MAVAAVTPRVRMIVICDEVLASSIEDGVFTLEGVRHHLRAASFPWRVGLSLFLLLSSPRKGSYSGSVLVIDERTDKAIRYVEFLAAFEEDNKLLPLHIEVGEIAFRQAGQYTFQVYFLGRGGDILKGEHPLTVLSEEE